MGHCTAVRQHLILLPTSH